MNSTRRNFIKKSAVTAGTILATSALKPFSSIIFAANEPEDPGKPWYGIGIDIEKCIGCGMCAKACKLENNVPEEPFYFRSWVEQYRITSYNVCYTKLLRPDAVRLYQKKAYKPIPNYGQYIGIENSICFEKKLNKIFV